MREYETTKLYYKKYPYKLVLYTPLSHWYRGGDLPYIRDTLDELHHQYDNSSPLVLKFWNREVRIKLADLHYGQKIYSALCKDVDYRLRVEGRDLSIYSVDKEWLLELADQVNGCALEWWEPKTLLQPNTIVMTSALKDWGYRITLGDNVPKSFYQWIKNNLDKVRIGPAFKESIDAEYSYMRGYYFYVKNDKALSLVTLVLGSSISKIDKIVIEDKNA